MQITNLIKVLKEFPQYKELNIAIPREREFMLNLRKEATNLKAQASKAQREELECIVEKLMPYSEEEFIGGVIALINVIIEKPTNLNKNKEEKPVNKAIQLLSEQNDIKRKLKNKKRAQRRQKRTQENHNEQLFSDFERLSEIIYAVNLGGSTTYGDEISLSHFEDTLYKLNDSVDKLNTPITKETIEEFEKEAKSTINQLNNTKKQVEKSIAQIQKIQQVLEEKQNNIIPTSVLEQEVEKMENTIKEKEKEFEKLKETFEHEGYSLIVVDEKKFTSFELIAFYKAFDKGDNVIRVQKDRIKTNKHDYTDFSILKDVDVLDDFSKIKGYVFVKTVNIIVDNPINRFNLFHAGFEGNDFLQKNIRQYLDSAILFHENIDEMLKKENTQLVIAATEFFN